VLPELLPKVVDLCAHEKGGGVPLRVSKRNNPVGAGLERRRSLVA
jgi:hypothetical protein